LTGQDPVYDSIGRTYRESRRADPRIVSALVRLLELPAGSTVCDVGAGSGNYTNALADAGFRMIAVEPSETMRAQAIAHERVIWKEGRAEQIPLGDAAACAVICTLAVHHFSDLAASAREMHRVCPEGPLLFFTTDPRRGEEQWFSEYFPEICRKDLAIFPAVEDFSATICAATGRSADVTAFPLPPDLTDQFMYAPWARPEDYLDPAFRANTSGFATADASLVEIQVARLAADLESGRWDARFGRFRHAEQNDAGFCFVRFRTTSPRARARRQTR
jgi:ubiquinone/menaquinone biosynthesis C-methylase UbiE